MHRRRFLRRAAAAGMVPFLANTAWAQTAGFPTKAIKLVVPYPAGGSGDLIGRIVAEGLAARYGQPMTVDNRPGAGGHSGAEFALRQPADGYTLVLATIAHNGAYKLYKQLRYNPAIDLVPVALVAESPNVLMVRNSLPVKTVPELLDYARANPGKLNYGSAGTGSATHMAAELFKHLAHVDIVAIPFSGGAPAMAALLGGQIDLTFETGSTAQQAIDSGRVRALAVTSPARSPKFPGLPAVAEFVPGYAAVPWYTISAPKGLPPAVLAQLNADITTVVRSPEAAPRWDALGVLPLGGSVDEAVRRNQVETRRWEAVIDSARLQVE
ncbi:tripartite tricarboxylate transporter substrate-binding protein [Variovorax sp. J2P1-59]|uniref:Bug family tripartite tricarboxylate transporter substrate binding protein n=1 Tax=Variovorax flavidus TaxID=3053501 RepID=UPI002576B610|nr:tripartite tricarboxylate transporter substrate-binding protein [Variovorax sp. J2P1-59]MDM0074448.1 tripartite tricarboxylate transporter substrate-binding protein [Variovorax sp. J2P1-59]